jgi:hypothetical protein
MGWVADDANEKAILHRDGPEIWRDIKTSISQAVAEYTRIYSPPGEVEVQFTNCMPSTDNCVRVRIVPPPGKKDTSFEVTFDIETWKVQCSGVNLIFKLEAMGQAHGHSAVIKDDNNKVVSAEDVSRAYLEPLFSKLPRLAPNIKP